MIEPIYRDPAKDDKLREAIARGFIQKQIDPDGIVRYVLTQQGQIQWIMERGATVFNF